MSEQEHGSSGPDRIQLPCGAEKSSLSKGWYSISDGLYHQESPLHTANLLLTNDELEWVSGQALIFPKDKATTLMVGRLSDLSIDKDLVDTQVFLDEPSGESSLRNEMKKLILQIDEKSFKEGGEGVEQVVDFGDLGIYRHNLQISNHPRGVTVVSFDYELGNNSANHEPHSDKLNFPEILMQVVQEPVTRKLNWVEFEGSFVMRDGDTVIIKGEKRIFCLRYFAGKDGKQPMFIKQVYPLETTIEDLHKELVVAYDRHLKAGTS